MKHFTWHHHQTVLKGLCVSYLCLCTDSSLGRSSLNVHTTHTFDLDQGKVLALIVNSVGKIKASGQTPPKVIGTLQIESLSSLPGTCTCPFMLARLDLANLNRDTRFHALVLAVSRYLTCAYFFCSLSLADVKLRMTLV